MKASCKSILHKSVQIHVQLYRFNRTEMHTNMYLLPVLKSQRKIY